MVHIKKSLKKKGDFLPSTFYCNFAFRKLLTLIETAHSSFITQLFFRCHAFVRWEYGGSWGRTAVLGREEYDLGFQGLK